MEAFVSPKDVFKNIRPKAIVFSDDENSRQFSELMKTGMTDLTLDDSSALKLETTAAFIQLSDDASSSVVHSALNAELVIERDKTDSKHLILTLENRSVLENMTSLSLSSSGHPTVKEEAEIFRQN